MAASGIRDCGVPVGSSRCRCAVHLCATVPRVQLAALSTKRQGIGGGANRHTSSGCQTERPYAAPCAERVSSGLPRMDSSSRPCSTFAGPRLTALGGVEVDTSTVSWTARRASEWDTSLVLQARVWSVVQVAERYPDEGPPCCKAVDFAPHRLGGCGHPDTNAWTKHRHNCEPHCACHSTRTAWGLLLPPQCRGAGCTPDPPVGCCRCLILCCPGTLGVEGRVRRTLGGAALEVGT